MDSIPLWSWISITPSLRGVDSWRKKGGGGGENLVFCTTLHWFISPLSGHFPQPTPSNHTSPTDVVMGLIWDSGLRTNKAKSLAKIEPNHFPRHFFGTTPHHFPSTITTHHHTNYTIPTPHDIITEPINPYLLVLIGFDNVNPVLCRVKDSKGWGNHKKKKDFLSESIPPPNRQPSPIPISLTLSTYMYMFLLLFVDIIQSSQPLFIQSDDDFQSTTIKN